MKASTVLLIAAVLLLAACGVSLWRGRTLGLYGVLEPRTTVFYWIIVATYGVLGVLSLIFAVRLYGR